MKPFVERSESNIAAENQWLEDEDFCLLGRLIIFRCYLSFKILFIECTTDKLVDKALVD